MQSAYAVLYCHLCPLWICHIFPHYLINGITFVKHVSEHKMSVLNISTTLFETFLILEEFSEISYMYVCLHVQYPLLLSDFNKVGNSRQIFEKCSNINESRPVGVELFNVDRQTAGHDEANRRSRNFANAASKEYP